MPHSHHSHSGQFCRHAKDSLEEVVHEVVRQGFESYGLTEHAPRYRNQDLYPEEESLHPPDLENTFNSFLEVASDLKKKYQDHLQLLIGIETENITTLDLEGAKRLIEDERIDYVVGSVHHVKETPIDFDQPTFLQAVRSCSSASLENNSTPAPALDSSMTDTSSPAFLQSLRSLFNAYLEAQYEMLQALKPEVVGHIDLCLLFTPLVSLRTGAPGENEARVEVWDKVIRNVKYVVAYGGLFEANSASLRKGWKTSYPSQDVLDLIMQEGGRICLSDDSHGVAQVGLNYLRMRTYLVGRGVKEIWYLVPASKASHADQTVGSRGRVVARKMEGWDAHEFWSKLDEKKGMGVTQ